MRHEREREWTASYLSLKAAALVQTTGHQRDSPSDHPTHWYPEEGPTCMCVYICMCACLYAFCACVHRLMSEYASQTQHLMELVHSHANGLHYWVQSYGTRVQLKFNLYEPLLGLFTLFALCVQCGLHICTQVIHVGVSSSLLI